MSTKSFTHKAATSFVMCVANNQFPASLELWKVYRVLPDEQAEKRSMIRVIDESGEDYLYPVNYFVSIRVPVVARKAMLALAS